MKASIWQVRYIRIAGLWLQVQERRDIREDLIPIVGERWLEEMKWVLGFRGQSGVWKKH